MGRITQRLNLTRKKTLHASERQTQRVQKLRAEFWTELGEVKLEDLIFVDEAGVNLAMTRHHARSPKGKRAYGKAPANKGRNVTLVGALSLEGIIAAFSFQGGNDKQAFTTDVEQILVPNLWEGACVVMDNFSSHKVEGIREAIEAAGARLVYLPPYSPDFNPIENGWSKVKEFLRAQEARTDEALDLAMTEALDAITPEDCISWFTHGCYYQQPN
jgi:transposase